MRVYKNLQKRNIPFQQLHEAASEMESRNAPRLFIHSHRKDVDLHSLDHTTVFSLW